VPNRNSAAAAVVASGGLLTLDGVSHEGVLEDQEKGDVLKIEILDLALRVPYGVI